MEIKCFLPNQSINIVYTTIENVIVMPITKTMEIVTSIQVCPISWMTINYKENSGKKLFLLNKSIKIVSPNEGRIIVVPTVNKMEIIMHFQVCLISWMNFDYKENGGNKSFSCQINASISCIPMR